MKKRAVIGAAIALVSVVFAYLLLGREPRYGGRSLTGWLKEYCETSMGSTQGAAEAHAAIRAIGVTKSLPVLFELIRAEENPTSTWLNHRSEQFGLRFLRRPSADDFQMYGLSGFEALGTNAAPAIEQLTKMVEAGDHGIIAVQCLAVIGKPAETALCQCLTNFDDNVQAFAVTALAGLTDDVDVYVGRIKDNLKSNSAIVRSSAVDCLGSQTNASELIIPLLVTALQDKNERVSARAAESLCKFGPQAMTAFPFLTRLVNEEQGPQSRAAMRALSAIAPIEAVPILSNAVVNGAATNVAHALNLLHPIAPRLSLQLTLEQFRSDDPKRRVRAIQAAFNYKSDTPEIVEQLKQACQDNDPLVARVARRAIKHRAFDIYGKNAGHIEIPDEPVFEGKSLGEWMKSDRNGDLSADSIRAIQMMGTNAIPALLSRLTYIDPVYGIAIDNVRVEAAKAFIHLGEKARPALPTLMALMDNENADTILSAMVSTFGTGSNSFPCLMKGLTNRFAMVRLEAANDIGSQWAHFNATQRAKLISSLLEATHDPEESVRDIARSELLELDPKTAAAAGVTRRPTD